MQNLELRENERQLKSHRLKIKSSDSRSYVHCVQLEKDTEVSYATIQRRNEESSYLK